MVTWRPSKHQGKEVARHLARQQKEREVSQSIMDKLLQMSKDARDIRESKSTEWGWLPRANRIGYTASAQKHVRLVENRDILRSVVLAMDTAAQRLKNLSSPFITAELDEPRASNPEEVKEAPDIGPQVSKIRAMIQKAMLARKIMRKSHAESEEGLQQGSTATDSEHKAEETPTNRE